MSVRTLVAACVALLLAGCATELSTHPVTPADLGTPVTQAAMLEAMGRPGVVSFEKIVIADWHFPNTTRTPGGGEWSTRQLDAQIYMYAIRHPRFGLYLIDGGMPADYERHFGLVLRNGAKDYGVEMRTTTGAWARDHGAPRGVFVTHLHYDHLLGVVELGPGVPVYLGPRDGTHAHALHRFIAGPNRDALEGRTVFEWRFATPPPGELAAIDVFGDGSVFAIHAPGHTPGSTAFLVNATTGPQLITGDAVHSREGWTGELDEANGFEADLPQIRASRAALQALAARIPGAVVHPGHQSLH